MAHKFIILIISLIVPTLIRSSTIKNDTQKLMLGTDKRFSLNKCCPIGKYVSKRRSCVKYTEEFNFSHIEVYDDNMRKTGKSIQDTFTLSPGKFEDEAFKDEALDVTTLDFNIYVTQSGVLQLEFPNVYNRWNPIQPANYCIDFRIMKDRSRIRARYWGILPGSEFVESSIYLTGTTFVSCFFMLLVLIVYFMLPELQNLCGMILMAYVASLFMAFLLLATIQIQQQTREVCIGLTMSIYFFFLASFCWMSVMSYDIWWTFRGYAKARPIHRRGERFKFLMYCLYAWGLPLLMTIGLAVLNTLKVEMRRYPWFVTPHVPELGCFLEGGVKLLYLYMPMLILIFCNWMFYLMTAFNIWRLSRGTAVLDSAAAGSPQAHRTHRHRLMVYLKLSVVMGLNWVLEIVSFLYPGFKMWYITDAYNILLGVAIFLIFVCKKKIFRKLCKRYLGTTTARRWYPSSKSYSSSTSDSAAETSELNSKVSSHPTGLNGYSMVSTKVREE